MSKKVTPYNSALIRIFDIYAYGAIHREPLYFAAARTGVMPDQLISKMKKSSAYAQWQKDLLDS